MLILFPSYIGTTSNGDKLPVQVPGQRRYKVIKREVLGAISSRPSIVCEPAVEHVMNLAQMVESSEWLK